jgi:hypothetical protein
LAVAALSACGPDVSEVEQDVAPVSELAVWDEALWRQIDVTLPSSPHPYRNNYNKTWTVSAPACAEAVRVRFSRLETESGYDFVTIKNKSNAQIQRVSGSYSDGFVSEPVPGNGLKIQLRTDYSITGHGFDVAAVEAVQGPVACPKIAYLQCDTGTVDANPPPGMCECPTQPNCVALDSFSAKLVTAGGFSGAGGGTQVTGWNDLRYITYWPSTGEEFESVATADKYLVQELARALIYQGFFDESGSSGETANMTSTFTATWQGVTRSVSWPVGEPSGAAARWADVIKLYTKATACGPIGLD